MKGHCALDVIYRVRQIKWNVQSIWQMRRLQVITKAAGLGNEALKDGEMNGEWLNELLD